MTDPVHPDPSDRAYSRPGGQDRDSAVEQVGVDPVHQPAEHIARREDQHHADRLFVGESAPGDLVIYIYMQITAAGQDGLALSRARVG